MYHTYAICWKNLKLKRYHWIQTSIEITIPIICFIVVVLIRSKVDVFTKVVVNETYHNPVDSHLIYSSLNIRNTKLFYAPKTDFTTDLIRSVQLKLGIYNEAIKGFPNEKELIRYYDTHGDDHTNAIVLFEDVNDSLPVKLKYDLKMYEKHVLWKTESLFQEFLPYVTDSGSETYLQKGFLPIQLALDTSFIELVSENDFNISMAFQEFPYPPHLQDNGINSFFLNLLPLFTTFSFIVLCVSTLKGVMKEKSSGINTLMKMHGLRSSTLWTGWLINGIFFIIPVIGVVLLLKCPWGENSATIVHCHGLILFSFLFLYCAASISSLLALTIMFHKTTISIVLGIILWIVPSVIFCAVTNNVDVTFLSIKCWLLLIPNISLFYGYSAISNFEQIERSLNLFEAPTGSSDDLTLGFVLVMLAADTVLYFLIALYFDQLYPGPHGISKSWNFLFKYPANRPCNGNSENKQSSHEIIVKARKLIMEFENRRAVDIYDLEIHKSKITALLGPNGAGKTTTMWILAGLLHPIHGTVLIDDLEINDQNLEEIQKQVTICPQEIILFDDLTVSEQLTFFGMLRGLSTNDSQQHANAILSEKLKLHDKAHHFTEEISGGMKKAVSLGISLIGKPKLLILDEPTAGIDIEGRAAIWELIGSLRQSNTILLSTHLMEEADELADRIAFIDNGVILCHDTPSNLKKSYDIGHQLMVKNISLDQLKKMDKKIGAVLDIDKKTEYSAKYHFPSSRKKSVQGALENSFRQQDTSVKSCNPLPNQKITKLEENAQHMSPLLSDESKENEMDPYCLFDDKDKEKSAKSPFHSESSRNTNVFQHPYHLSNYRTRIKMREIVQNKQPLTNECEMDPCSSFHSSNYPKRVFQPYVHKEPIIEMEDIILMDSFILNSCSLEEITDMEDDLDNFINRRPTTECSAKYRLKSQPKSALIDIFRDLENEKITFNLANPTVEDLFIKVIEKHMEAQEKDHMKISFSDEPREREINSGVSPKRTTRVLIEKRVRYMSKKWTNYISMPLMMLLTTLLVIYLCGDGIVYVNKDGRKLNLVLNAYGETGVFYSSYGTNNSLLPKTYSDIIKRQRGVPKNVENMQQVIIEKGKENIARYHQRMIIGTEFHSIDDAILNVTVMYSHNALHGVAISLNVAMNTLLKFMIGEEHSIVASNTPLHSVQNRPEQVEQSSTSNLIIWLTLFPLGPLFILSNAILLVQAEDSSLVKHLQYIAGVRQLTYWIVNYLCDFIYCTVAVILCALAFFFTEIYEPGTLIVILVLYVATAVPFSYIFCKSRQLETGYSRFILSNISAATILTSVILSMEFSNDELCRYISDKLRYLFAINPQFTLNYLLAKYSDKMVANHNWNIKTPNEKNNICNYDRTSNVCCEGEVICGEYQSFFNDKSFIYIWIVTIVFAVIVMVFLWFQDHVDLISNKNEDLGQDPGQVLKADEVTKSYYHKNAIDHLSFYVKEGRCVAILGPNGAGKSTAFRLLAKQEKYSSGNIKTNSARGENYQKRGYCPQQDALIGEFTGKEMVNIFAELRGIDSDTVTNLLKKFDLLKYADEPCGHYSGGNKRKLNVCISMIANPQIIMLDEPTTGVDPISRKKIWNIIENLKADNSSIILSSHSMGECEAFCDVLMILKNGEKIDIASLEQLKEKYSAGFVIKLMISNTEQTDRKRIEESIKEDFKEPKIIVSKNDLIYFHVKDISWHEVIQKLEQLKESHNVEDYDVNKSTLQDVFLKVIEKKETINNSQTPSNGYIPLYPLLPYQLSN